MEMERKERGRNGKREQKQRVKETQRTRGRCRVIMRERGWGGRENEMWRRRECERERACERQVGEKMERGET